MLTSIKPSSNNDRHLNIPNISNRLMIPEPLPRTRSTLKRIETAGIKVTEDAQNYKNDDRFKLNNQRLKRVSSTNSMMSDDQIKKRQILWDTNFRNKHHHLIEAKDEECKRHPISIASSDVNHNAPDIECSVMIKKIRSIDAIGSSVDCNLIFTLRWKAPHLIGKRVNKELLWKPTLSIINYDKLDFVYEDPWFYPETGDVRLLIKVSGTFSNEQNLRFFPFDYDYINLDFCIELGTGDESARLLWDPSRDHHTGQTSLHRMIPLYVKRELKEWKIHENLTSARRHKPLGNIVGTMTGIQVRFHVTRKITFYIAKIYSLLW